MQLDRALAEARRVLVPGGRFLCLEFATVPSPALRRAYDAYSFTVLPWLGARVAGDRRFTVTATMGTTTLPRTSHKAPFAPAQFFEMRDDEKLAAPSFETMDAGCVFGEPGVSFDAAQVIPAPLEYQDVPIVLDGPPPIVSSNASPPPQTSAAAVQRCGSGSRAQAPGTAGKHSHHTSPAASRSPKPHRTRAPRGSA